jgi:hypothetical protein
MKSFTWGESGLMATPRTRSVPGVITASEKGERDMLNQQILYPVEEVQKIAAQAYQSGVNAGYMLAVKEDMLDLEAMKREEERQQIINLQGLRESGQGGCNCGCDN